MRTRKSAVALLGATILALLLAPSAAIAATPAPAWSIQPLASPTVFLSGEQSELNKKPRYQVFVTNNGAEKTDSSPIKIVDTLPAGLTVKSVELAPSRGGLGSLGNVCKTEVSGEVSTVSCEVAEPVPPKLEPARLSPGDQMLLEIKVSVLPSGSGPLVNRVKVEGGGAETVTAEGENEIGNEGAKAGFEEFRAELSGADGRPASAADTHPYQYTTSFGLNVVPAPPGATGSVLPAEGDVKEIEVALPPGLAGNPTATPRCTAQQFTTHKNIFSPLRGNSILSNECPVASAVGVAYLEQLEGESGVQPHPIYNLAPPKGMPAQFGFEILALPIYINTKLRSDGDYGVTAYLHNVTQAKRITAGRFTFWGVPGEESHDRMRGECAISWETCPAVGTPRPFLRMPSSCANPLTSTMSFTTWAQPATGASEPSLEAAPTACAAPPSAPTIEAKPSTDVADAPSGLHVDLHLPQKGNEDPDGVAHADLRDATVTLPPGLSVNPASADGLAACSLSQIGYEGIEEGKSSFSTDPANCPDAAKIGTVEIDSPLVDHPLPGAIYLAKQSENPFGSLIALYIAIDDPETGVVIKLPGKVLLDPVTGQVTNVFEQNPQLPFEDLKVDLFEGARAPLRTPQTCGESATVPNHTTTTSLVPWTAPEGLTAHPTDSFALTQASGGGACAASKAALPNTPSFEAGPANPVAGAYSPFVLRLKREDGSQELGGLNLTLPPGLTARLAGTPECSEAAIAQAQSRNQPGQGALEQQSPSCPPASQLGTVTVGAGAGPTPFYATGKAYLAGPYKGAPLSMEIVTPAVAGPFDLGAVAVRTPLYLDPESARVTVKSDPIPTIVQGIPLDVRSIAVKIDKPDFTLNPTSCDAMAIAGEAISTQGQVAPLNNRFQVGGCQNLGFKPSLALKLKGGSKRGDHPALTATLTYPKGGAYSNIAKAQVALPHSEFLDTTHIKTICTRVQFAASQCPKGAIYGFAKAITPLLDKPLEGPVYLRSSSHPLPDLVADLNGQIHVVLAGRVDSIHGGTRNTFEAVPDAPVSKFTLSLPAGKKGLLQNSTDICKGTHKATADFTAHNGKTLRLKPELQAKCPKARKHKRKPSSHQRP
jgi:hypothetical protein